MLLRRTTTVIAKNKAMYYRACWLTNYGHADIKGMYVPYIYIYMLITIIQFVYS